MGHFYLVENDQEEKRGGRADCVGTLREKFPTYSDLLAKKGGEVCSDSIPSEGQLSEPRAPARRRGLKRGADFADRRATHAGFGFQTVSFGFQEEAAGFQV